VRYSCDVTDAIPELYGNSRTASGDSRRTTELGRVECNLPVSVLLSEIKLLYATVRLNFREQPVTQCGGCWYSTSMQGAAYFEILSKLREEQ
jgi:hypothetical protein